MADEYIEREAAIKAYTNLLKKEGDVYTTDITDALLSVPAADVQPVRHGRWRLYSPLTDTYECDKCGYQVIDESINYCPNCGASMARGAECLSGASYRLSGGSCLA